MLKVYLIFVVHWFDGSLWYDHDAVFRMTRAECMHYVRMYPGMAECHKRLPK